ERRGRAQPYRDLAATDRDGDVVPRPTRQRLPHRRRRRASGGERQRPRLGGTVREGERVARRQELQRHEGGEEKGRQRRDQLHGCLALLPADHSSPRPERAPTSTRGNGSSRGTATLTETASSLSARSSPSTSAPARSDGGRARFAAFAASPPTSAARAPARAATLADHRACPASAI